MIAYLWPDGEYQSTEDDEIPNTWKSDDFIIVEVPDDAGLDDYMHQMHLEVNLGQSCERKTL